MEKETGSIKVLTEKGVRDSVCEEGLNTYSPHFFYKDPTGSLLSRGTSRTSVRPRLGLDLACIYI